MTLPNKLELRRLWFTIHKWLGLALAAPVVLIFLTGSLLLLKISFGWSPMSRPMRYAHIIHGSLYLGWAGGRLVGAIAFLLLLSAFSGLWLWWPMKGPVLRALRWRRTQSTNANLHHLTGYWLAIPLAVLSLTGASISFRRQFSRVSSDAAMTLMRQIHDGTGMPAVWRLVIFLSGLAGAAMAVTGVIMWLKGQRREVRMRGRRTGRAPD